MMLDSIYHMTLRLLCNLISAVKTLYFCHIVCNVVMDVITFGILELQGWTDGMDPDSDPDLSLFIAVMTLVIGVMSLFIGIMTLIRANG